MVQLLDYLRHRTMLLVLDDVDDDPALRRAIVELYQRALYLTLLVIADRPLEVEEILNLPLEGLPVPPSSSRPAPEDLMAYDSVALFVERAQEANEGFQLGAGNGRDVIRLCRALNGTPLGIELAAAWAGPRSLSALAHGIQRSLNRVAGDASEIQAPPTLRAAFAYAWQQLPPPMRRKLAELTVFQHDFDQAAAAAVTGSTAGDLDVLVDSALLSRPATGQYTWHAGLWRLARRRLSTPSHAGPVSMLAAGEVDPAADPSTLRRRHAAHYLGLLAERGQAICGEHPQPPASQIRQVWRNVRQAWCWAVQQRQADLLAPPVEALSCYLHLRGPLWEGEELFGMAAYALAEAAEEDPEAAALLTRLLVEEARFVNGQARYGRAAQIAERVIDLARAQRTADGDAAARLALEAAGHRERGKALRSQGDHAAARDELEQALRQGAESDAHGVMASSWHHLGLLALEEERHEEAQEAFQRALQLYRDLGHRRGEANLINELGALALQQRRYPAAQSQLKDALRLHQAIGDRRGESAAQNNLARLADAQGDYELANAYGQRAVCTARDVGDQQGEAQALATLGLLCLHEGKNETAWNRSLQAVELARALGDRAREGRALVILGHAFMELEMLDQAAAAYQQALGLQRALGQSDLAAESLAGLARASLDRNDLAQAQSYVETIWEKLENGDLHGANEPLRVYLTCYQVLRETGDPRANTVLTTASGMFDDLA
jgi:tetratricopeptide (TPR) repeat protein